MPLLVVPASLQLVPPFVMQVVVLKMALVMRRPLVTRCFLLLVRVVVFFIFVFFVFAVELV